MFIEEKRFENLNYLLCLPDDFTETKNYPIILHLHGAGSRGNDPSILKNQAILSYAASVEVFPFVMLLPQCSADSWFDVFEQLEAFVEHILSLQFAEKGKIFLSGVSMGGYASWQMLMSKNTAFTKAIICCGGGMYWNAARIKAEIWAFHSKDDNVVYFEESEKMVKAVLHSGGKARLTFYEDGGHNCWDRTYSNPDIYNWLIE